MTAGAAPAGATAAPAAPAAPAATAAPRGVRVLRNVVSSYLRFGVSGLMGFLITPVMVHLLGDRDYGLWVTIFSLTGYFGLFDQGIRPSLVRYLSRDHARGDFAGMRRTLSSALALYGGVGVVVLALTVVAAAIFPQVFHLDPTRVADGRTVVLLAGLSLALGFPLGVFGAALSGLQRYDLANAIGVGISILRALAFVVVLRAGGGLIALAWASLAANVLGHLLSWLMVRRLLPGVSPGRDGVTRGQLAMLGSYSGFAFMGAVAERIAFQTDALVITAMLGAALVTPFSLAAGLLESARSLVYAASFVLAPTASELDTRGERDTLHTLVIAGARYSVLLAWPVLIGLMVFGADLLATWVGPRFESSARLVDLLAAPTMLSLPQATAGAVLYGVSRHRGVVMLGMIGALLNLGLSILWARPLGLMGVALGTAVPVALVSGIAMFVFTVRALGLPLGRYLVHGWLVPGLASLAFAVPAVVVERMVHPVGWLPLAGVVIPCWALFAVIAWRFAIPASDRRRWGKMVRGLARPTPAAVPLPAPAAAEGRSCA